jgi:polyphosphate kinase
VDRIKKCLGKVEKVKNMEFQQPNGSTGLLEKEQKESKKHKKQKIYLNADESEQFGQKKLDKKEYEKELATLQTELVKMQYWSKHSGYRLVILFEGRDAAGKGGTIKRIAEPLNPRGCRVVALGTPSDREKTQWYFQRYVEHLPSAGEIVLFDRSWYNRAGVEHVMGFCTDRQYQEFMHSCPEFERMLVRSGIMLLKYWFSVSDEEQEKRFQSRTTDPARPWFTVEANDKKRARLNCISHILSKVSYTDMTPEPMELPPRRDAPEDYVRPPRNEQFFVPSTY